MKTFTENEIREYCKKYNLAYARVIINLNKENENIKGLVLVVKKNNTISISYKSDNNKNGRTTNRTISKLKSPDELLQDAIKYELNRTMETKTKNMLGELMTNNIANHFNFKFDKSYNHCFWFYHNEKKVAIRTTYSSRKKFNYLFAYGNNVITLKNLSKNDFDKILNTMKDIMSYG